MSDESTKSKEEIFREIARKVEEVFVLLMKYELRSVKGRVTSGWNYNFKINHRNYQRYKKKIEDQKQ